MNEDFEELVGAIEEVADILKKVRPGDVTVNPPNVSVEAPSVTVNPPNVSVEAPSVSVTPEIVLKNAPRSYTVEVTDRDRQGAIRKLTINPIK